MLDWKTKERRILRAIDKHGFFVTANGNTLRLCEDMRQRGLIRSRANPVGSWERYGSSDLD